MLIYKQDNTGRKYMSVQPLEAGETEITQAEFYADVDFNLARGTHEELLSAKQKIDGVDYQGTMMSVTREDQNGLIAVWVDYQADPANFEPTVFEFANGNKLEINKDNFQAIYLTWRNYRKTFFAV